MRPPRPVLAAAALGGNLPRHRGRRFPQPASNHGERLPGMQAQGDLLPVGHRQPRAGDVPNEKNLSDPNSAMNKEDAALDRKIKSICRGC